MVGFSMQDGRCAGRGLVVAGATIIVALAVIAVALAWMAMRAAHPPLHPDGGEVNDGAQASNADYVDWERWHAINPAVIAWIEVPGTAISQPVVQAPVEDPCYYLTHDVYGEWNLFGCPYVDAGCILGLDSWNLVIMGHNISTPPAMFHDLERYHEAAFAREHEKVLLYTPSGKEELSVVATNTVRGDAEIKRVQFHSEADFKAYRDELVESSAVRVTGDAVRGWLVTLCTCSYYYNPENERTLVYAQRQGMLRGESP